MEEEQNYEEQNYEEESDWWQQSGWEDDYQYQPPEQDYSSDYYGQPTPSSSSTAPTTTAGTGSSTGSFTTERTNAEIRADFPVGLQSSLLQGRVEANYAQESDKQLSHDRFRSTGMRMRI